MVRTKGGQDSQQRESLLEEVSSELPLRKGDGEVPRENSESPLSPVSPPGLEPAWWFQVALWSLPHPILTKINLSGRYNYRLHFP